MRVTQPIFNYTYRCACGALMLINHILAGRLAFCTKCGDAVITPRDEGMSATKVHPQKLLTERLELRPAVPGDWKVLLPITSDPLNYGYELSAPDDRRTLIKSLKRSRFPAGFRKSLHLMFLATSRADGAAIGLLHLRLEPSHLAGYFGIMLHHPFHRMGYGTEAAEAVVRFGFEELGLHRINVACDEENAACVALLKKGGFNLEGMTVHGSYHLDRGWVNIMNFGMINPTEVN